MKTLTKTKKAFNRKPQTLRVYIKPNYRWTDRWLEQINEVGNKVKATTDNGMDDFYFYTDINQVG